MRILFLAHRIPYPPEKGDKLRAFHEIVQLSERHEVHLACLVDRREDLRYVNELRNWCRTVSAVRISRWGALVRVALALVRGGPLSVAYFCSNALKRKIQSAFEDVRFDLVFIYCSSMAQYVVSRDRLPKLIDLVDVDSDKWGQYAKHARFPRSWLYSVESSRLRKYEQHLAREFSPVLFVSQREADLFSKICPEATSVAISNGVDLEYFQPPEPTAARLHYKVVFTGAMDYYPNVDAVTYFCDDILPLIQAEIPDVEFSIAGSNPSARVRRLAKRRGVVVSGSVPDIRPYLASAQVFVAPFRMARGIQNKLLEAMAMGLPTVVTSIAASGIPHAESLLVADDPRDFAHVTLRLLKDRASRASIGRTLRQTVEQYYRWQDSMGRLERVVTDVAERSRTAAEKIAP